MRLNIQNFGIIESASVNINGLTVICGENDSGKSTIGKLLFAMIKASQKYEEELGEGVISQIFLNLSRISVLLLQGDRDESLRNISIYFRRLDPDEILLTKDLSSLYSIIDDNVSDLSLKNKIYEYISKIDILIQNTPNEKKAKENALKKALYSEFKNFSHKSSEIKLNDLNNDTIIKFNSDKKGVSNIVFDKPMLLDDVTYIENPFILQFRRMFLNAITLLDESNTTRSWVREKVSLHLKDLARKLSVLDPKTIEFSENKLQKLSNNISELIDGSFYYDEEQDDFILNRNGHVFSSMNIASGIKALGLFNSLLKGGFVNERSLLILDEPETNLHPKWQNEYAKLLCNLVKSNIKIIIATHSPYMISALEHYSKDIENKNFYWARKDYSESVIFEDETSSIMENIVQKFADAFNEID
ncbi:MAG: AAA family ATPase [Haemophilus parainfluenzae]|jgi:hypothetical protein|nr:AAA family ATPase [uncultured Haemophilus sp.]MBS5162901.1 AAA family ATPase [Haemophilus parainfluenzae]MDU3949193.1 AAA family ATPase [Haemophilus parainfluenzae]